MINIVLQLLCRLQRSLTTWSSMTLVEIEMISHNHQMFIIHHVDNIEISECLHQFDLRKYACSPMHVVMSLHTFTTPFTIRIHCHRMSYAPAIAFKTSIHVGFIGVMPNSNIKFMQKLIHSTHTRTSHILRDEIISLTRTCAFRFIVINKKFREFAASNKTDFIFWIMGIIFRFAFHRYLLLNGC